MEQRKANRLKEAPPLFNQYVNRYFNEMRQARLEGKKVAWTMGYPIAIPLLVAMDIPYFFAGGYAAGVAARHREEELQKIAEKAGYMEESCAYIRNSMGCARYPEADFEKADPIWQMPRAEFVISGGVGCSLVTGWGEDMRLVFDVPMFIFDTPYVWTMEDEKEAVQVCINQLEELATFLEDMTKKKFPWKRLKEIMASVREVAMLRKGAWELCKAKPSPATFFDLLACIGGINYYLGKPECEHMFRTLRDEIKARVKRGEGAVPDEKYRLYWDGLMCWSKFGHLGNKFAQMGASVVCDRYIHRGFFNLPESIDPQKPLEGLAINVVASHSNHNLDWLIENISNLCVEYSIDGLVCIALHTCRTHSALQLEIMDGVSRKLGIPGIFFEADVASGNYYSDSQVETRLQALFEIIDSRKRR